MTVVGLSGEMRLDLASAQARKVLGFHVAVNRRAIRTNDVPTPNLISRESCVYGTGFIADCKSVKSIALHCTRFKRENGVIWRFPEDVSEDNPVSQ